MENSITNNTEPQTEKTTLQKVCDMFVSRDELRPAMCTVFTNGNRAYATDAHALISLPVSLIDFQWQQPENPPKAEPILNEVIYNSKWFTIKHSELSAIFEQIPFEDVFEDCPECGGEGKVECESCGALHECSDCNGEGSSEVIIGTQKKQVQIALDHKHGKKDCRTFLNSTLLYWTFAALDMLGCKDESLTVCLQDAHTKPAIIEWGEFLFMVMPMIHEENLLHTIRAIPCK